MPEVTAYKATERRGETFSYLPPMTPERLRKQIAYLIAPGMESGDRAYGTRESVLELLVSLEAAVLRRTSVERILAELEACHRANPGHHVRLSATTTTRSPKARRSSSTARAPAEPRRQIRATRHAQRHSGAA